MIRAEFAVAAIVLGITVAVAQLDAIKEYCTSRKLRGKERRLIIE